MNGEGNSDKIEAYLYNQLSEDDRKALEIAAAKDESLQEKIRLHELELEALQLIDQGQLRNQFKVWKKEKNNTVGVKVVELKPKRPWKRILAIAATFLVLAIAAIGVFIQTNYSNDILADANMFDTSFSGKGTGTIAPENALRPILNLMELGNYSAAIAALNDLEDSEFRERALLLKAENYYKIGNLVAAKETFKIVQQEAQNTTYGMSADFGLAVVLVKTRETKAALSHLNSIASNSEHLYQKEAQVLVNKLNSSWRNFVW